MNKTFYTVIVIFLLVFLLFQGKETYAAQAQLLLYPTRIVLENNENTATVGLKNPGDATGSYRIELIDMVMPEHGAPEEVKAENAEYSARKMIRISPRSVMLEAGQDQNIRLMIRKPRTLEDGEYRAHLKVTMVEDDAANVGRASAGKGVGIVVKPRLSLVIPVIIRHGEVSYTVKLTDAKLRYIPDESGKKVPYIDIDFLRTGNRSSMGDIEITYTPQGGGKAVIVKTMAGIAVYRPTERRKVSFPLDVPQGITLNKGTLRITYRAQEKEGGAVLAEGNFPI